MPSRERVTIVITEGDSENDEPTIISEVTEIVLDGEKGEQKPGPKLCSQESEICSIPSLRKELKLVGKPTIATSKSMTTTKNEILSLDIENADRGEAKACTPSTQRTLGFFFSKPSKSTSGAKIKKTKKQTINHLADGTSTSAGKDNAVLTSSKETNVAEPNLNLAKKNSALKSNSNSNSTQTPNAPQQKSISTKKIIQSKTTTPKNSKVTTPKRSQLAPKRSTPNSSKNQSLDSAEIMSIVLGRSYPTENTDAILPSPVKNPITTVCGVVISALLPELVTRDRNKCWKTRGNKLKKSPSVKPVSNESSKKTKGEENLPETTVVSDTVMNEVTVSEVISNKKFKDLVDNISTPQSQASIITVNPSSTITVCKATAQVDELTINKEQEMECTREEKVKGTGLQKVIRTQTDEVVVDKENMNEERNLMTDVHEDIVDSNMEAHFQTGVESKRDVTPTRKLSFREEIKTPIKHQAKRMTKPNISRVAVFSVAKIDVAKEAVTIQGQVESNEVKSLNVTDLKMETPTKIGKGTIEDGRGSLIDVDFQTCEEVEKNVITATKESSTIGINKNVQSQFESDEAKLLIPIDVDFQTCEEVEEHVIVATKGQLDDAKNLIIADSKETLTRVKSNGQDDTAVVDLQNCVEEEYNDITINVCSKIETSDSLMRDPNGSSELANSNEYLSKAKLGSSRQEIHYHHTPTISSIIKETSNIVDLVSLDEGTLTELLPCGKSDSPLHVVATNSPARDIDCDKVVPSCNSTKTVPIKTQQTDVCNDNIEQKSTGAQNQVEKVGKRKKINTEKQEPLRQLSEAEKSIIKQHDAMGKLYLNKVEELVKRASSGEFIEEEFQQDIPKKIMVDKDLNLIPSICSDEFRDEWLPGLALVVQGSHLPLNSLALTAHEKIIGEAPDLATVISINAVISKIKLIASRTQYLLPVPSRVSPIDKIPVDIYSNNDVSMMWRWELSSLDLLDGIYRATVKRARSARKKIRYHQKSILKLLSALKYADKQIRSSSQGNWAPQIAKINADEEKVLKYEREEEKARLILSAKAQKERGRVQKQLEKQKEKEKIDDERRKEKAQKQEQRQMKLQMKLKEANDLKKKKDIEAAEGKEQANRQKVRMMSFFKNPSVSCQKKCAANDASLKTCTKKVDRRNERHPAVKNNLLSDVPEMDSEQFWTILGSDTTTSVNTPPFLNLSKKARSSRKNRTHKVNVTVFVNVVSENAFEQQPYDEERTVLIRNKYKYLSFHEDNRPPYYGTWSKDLSKEVTGRKPFAKDTKYLDYDFDSEAEWEEGDDEQGEDCSVNDKEDDEMDDEEGDSRKYNFQDGWLAQDDDLGPQDENDDEETMVMRRKKIEEGNGSSNMIRGTKFSPASVVAPMMGGLPQIDAGLVEGLSEDDARALLFGHDVISLQPSIELCLDAYPPIVEPDESKIDCCSVGSRKRSTKMSSQDLTDEDLKIFAKFVHRCTLKSKDIVVESLRSIHKDLTSSRAQATRKLDLIATKRRLKKGGGVIWEVKDDVLISLGLQDLVVTKEERIHEEILVKAPKNPSKTVKKAPSTKERKKKKEKKTCAPETPHISPVIVSPYKVTPAEDTSLSMISGNKRKVPSVSVASANLLAAFLTQKKKA